MGDVTKKLKARRRAVLKCRLIAWLLPLCSLGVLLGAPAITTRMSATDFLARLASPVVIFLLGLFSLIYLPACVRIYYILLLNSKGVFTAAERQAYQAAKRRWEKLLLRAAFLAGILVVILAVWRWAGR